MINEKIIRNFGEIAPKTITAAKVFNWKEIADRYDSIYKQKDQSPKE